MLTIRNNYKKVSLYLQLSNVDKTHLTLVFFRDFNFYLREIVLEQALEYIKEHYHPNYEMSLIYGDLYGQRSYHISGPIKKLQEGLLQYFSQLGYNVDLSEMAHTPHVDSRGHDKKDLRKTVHLINDLKL